jgi:hypothetical protein
MHLARVVSVGQQQRAESELRRHLIGPAQRPVFVAAAAARGEGRHAAAHAGEQALAAALRAVLLLLAARGVQRLRLRAGGEGE